MLSLLGCVYSMKPEHEHSSANLIIERQSRLLIGMPNGPRTSSLKKRKASTAETAVCTDDRRNRQCSNAAMRICRFYRNAIQMRRLTRPRPQRTTINTSIGKCRSYWPDMRLNKKLIPSRTLSIAPSHNQSDSFLLLCIYTYSQLVACRKEADPLNPAVTLPCD